MRRLYTPEDFAALAARIAAALPDAGLGADVIAGFPGEEEEDFEETVRLVRALPLTYLHVFPFSRRPGTAAADLPDQVSPEDRERRAAILRALGREKAAAFRERHLGRTVRVLIEGRPGRARGLTGNYLKVVVRATASDIGQLRDLRVTRHEEGALHGAILPGS
jgi:threonylcarbamoyladenosine tRNA methylthiotransferase MtaB